MKNSIFFNIVDTSKHLAISQQTGNSLLVIMRMG